MNVKHLNNKKFKMRSQNGILLHGNHFDVEDIINRPEEFIRPDESGHSLLHTACEIADIKSVEEIIRVNRWNLKNAIDMKGLSHFHVVAISSFTDVLERFLKEDVVPDINAAISDMAKFLPGFTALHIACLQRNVEHVEVLLRFGAHPNVKNAFGHTPYDLLLWESVRLNGLMDPDTIRYFYTKSKYRKYIDKFKIDETITCKIKLRNIFKIIRLILKAAKGNKEFDDKGFSKLHFLVCEAQLPVTLELQINKHLHLVNAKVREDVPFYGGLTPLHMAAYFHYDDIVSFLLKHGADPHIKTNEGENALTLRLKDFYKAFKNDPNYEKKAGKRSSLIPTLMDPILLLNNQDYIDKFGMKTIHLAVGTNLEFFDQFYSSEHPDIDELVGPCESEYNYYEGNTPLHLALMFERYDIANYLIRNGANVNIANKSGDTPLKLYRDKGTLYNLMRGRGDVNYNVKT